MAIALELADDIDQVLEHARTRNTAVLGDMADQEHRDAPLLGHGDQCSRDRAHLRHTAGRPLGLRRGDGLHRVDYEE